MSKHIRPIQYDPDRLFGDAFDNDYFDNETMINACTMVQVINENDGFSEWCAGTDIFWTRKITQDKFYHASVAEFIFQPRAANQGEVVP